MYTLKIYKNLFSTLPYNQIETIDDINIEDKLDDFSTLSFMIKYFKTPDGVFNCEGIEELQRIVLAKQSNGEKIVFDGYIYTLDHGVADVIVEARDYRSFLNDKKFLTADKVYTSQTLGAILLDLCSTLNARTSSDTYVENWTSFIDTDSTAITQTYKKNDSIYNILKNLSSKTGKKFGIVNGKIIFKTIYGIDRTIADENYTELIYNYKATGESNIGTPRAKTYSSLVNSFLSPIPSVDSTSINARGRFEGVYSTDPTATEKIERAERQKKYTFDVIPSRLPSLSIGDKVVLDISADNPFLNYVGSQIITRIKTTIRGGIQEITEIEVSDFVVKETDVISKINYLLTTVKKLQL